ncbi:hypothetical protein BD560DRAFT_414789 [Blakeslea trispora]|nr:hypothetical protein BD560DRAFT_414789 [Blakeslea trispora]
MTGHEKMINLKLTAETMAKLTKQKSIVMESIKPGILELVLDDTRIRIDTNTIKKPTEAIYYNNNSSTLHYLGDAMAATTSIKKVPNKKVAEQDTIARRIELLDIPSSAEKPVQKKPSKKTIPPPVPTSITPPVKPFSPTPSELKYPIRVRILQRLALQPRSLIELVKSLNRKQPEKCEQLEVKRILETVGIPIKKDDRKKFCLKPNLYKEIQIWDWPFYSQAEKQTVADNAKEAYDLLLQQGLETDRSNLYHLDSPYKPKSPTITKKSSPIIQRKPTPQQSQPPPPLPPLPPLPPPPQQQQVLEKGKGRSTPLAPPSPSTPQSEKLSPQTIKSRPPATPLASQHLKPSSANKKYTPPSKPLLSVNEKSLTPMKRKIEEDTPIRDSLTVPSTKKRPDTKPIKTIPQPIQPINIKSQRLFDAYCHNYVHARTDYSRIKKFFKHHFPHYIKALETTLPPKGTKRSYYDLKVEYQGMVKANYLKQQHQTEEGLKEAESFLIDCNNKRRRLNYMWASIKQNIDQHHYRIPKTLLT